MQGILKYLLVMTEMNIYKLQVYDNSGEIEYLYREDFENDEIIMGANLKDVDPSNP